MKITCWNAAFCSTRSSKASAIRSLVAGDDVELACIPESLVRFLPDGWHGIFGGADWGYPIKEGQRKIALWSRRPWTEVDAVGSPGLPPGRFVSGVTETSAGPVQVIGVCVPWAFAHVSTGSRDRARWADHMVYLQALREVLGRPRRLPSVLVGDLNQRLPRRRVPLDAFEALQTALTGYTVWTKGEVPGLVDRPVCHIAGTEHFRVTRVVGFPRLADGKELSDHDGLAVEVSLG